MAPLVRGLIAVGVPLSILTWGGIYFGACIDVLKAPDAPIAMQVVGVRDVLTIEASSYTVNFSARTVGLRDVRFVSKRRGRIGSARSLNLTDYGSWPLGSPRIVVNADDIEAHILRLPSGDLAIQDLLPPPSEPTSPIPISMRLHDVKLDLEDQRAKSRRVVEMSSVTAKSLGDDWRIQSDVKVERAGSMSLEVRLRPKGLWAVSVFAPETVDGTDLLKDALSWLDPKTSKQVQELSIGGIQFKGDLALRNDESGFGSKGSLAVRGQSVRFSGVSLEDLEGTVAGDTDSLQVRLSGRSKGSSIQFLGQVNPQTPSLAGLVNVRTGSESDLGKLPGLVWPKEARFRSATYDGWIQWEGGNKFATSGIAKAQDASYGVDMISAPKIQVAANDSMARIRLLEGTWRGQTPTAEFAVGMKSQSLQGSLQLGHMNVKDLGTRFGFKGWSGTLGASSMVTGTLSKPVAEVQVVGVIQPPKSRLVSPPVTVEAQLSVSPDRVEVRRSIFQTALGGATVGGHWSKLNGLDIDGLARGLDFQAIGEELAGSANMAFHITGPATDPRLTGRVEAYDIAYGTWNLPLALLEVKANRQQVDFPSIRLVRGPANLTGKARWVLKSDALSGSFSGDRLQVAEFAGEDYLGFIKVNEGKISGTMKRPRVHADLRANQLLLGGIKVSEITGDLDYVDNQVQIENGSVILAGGQVQGNGYYNPATENGQFAAKFTHLNLSDLAPDLAAQVTVKGRFDGDLAGTVKQGELRVVNGKGTLERLILNETDFGSGDWTVLGQDGPLQLDFSLGTIDRYVSGTAIRFNPSEETLSGSADIYNFSAKDIIESTRRYQKSLSDEWKLRLASVEGALNASIAVQGKLDDLKWTATTVAASDLKVGGHDFGKVAIAGDYRGGRSNLTSFDLDGPSGSLKMKGLYDKKAGLSVDGELARMPLAVLDILSPSFAGLSGTLDELSFLAEGPIDGPTVRASAKLAGLLASPGAKEDETLRILMDTISLEPVARPNGTLYSSLTAQGKFFYRGFQGDMDGLIPMDLTGANKVPSAKVSLNLARRDLKEIASLIEGFDADRTEGGVEGGIVVAGQLDALKLSGRVVIKAPSLARNGIDAILRDASIGLGFSGNEVQFEAKATSSRGGDMQADLKTSMDGLEDLGSLFQPGRINTLLDHPIKGSVKLNNLQARQKFAGTSYVDAVATGEIQIQGVLRKPQIVGDLGFSGVDTILPPFASQEGPPLDLPIDPEFAVKLHTIDPARVRTTGADLRLFGQADLTGTLTSPIVNGSMNLSSGTLKLPNHEIRLEPGGRIRAFFDGDPNSGGAQLDVDLEGRTALTSRRPDLSVERYSIQLHVQGDLLKDGGLVLSAESDPPDLTQDQILAQLGQTQLLESFGGSVSGNETERRIRDALAGYALPAVFGNFTETLAKSLAFDFLTLEYNQYDAVTFSFAKRLGPGLTFIGRRQLGEPPPGFAKVYEWKLQYRPVRRGLLGRFGLSFGADQDRPWKLSLDYTIRF